MKKLATLTIAAMLALTGVAMGQAPMTANAATADTQATVAETQDVEPRLMTNLTLNLAGANGVMTATVENTFTLFPSTVQVTVQLFSSYTLKSSYGEMTQRGSAYIADLDMGKTISASATTYGEQMYWMARVVYTENSGAPKEVTTKCALYDGDGNFISY